MLKALLVAAALLAPSALLAAEIKVTMAGGKYTPDKIAAKVGDVLVFVNDDAVDHNVFSASTGHGIDTGRQRAGESRQIRLARAGTIDIECVFHPHMHATVTVAR